MIFDFVHMRSLTQLKLNKMSGKFRVVDSRNLSTDWGWFSFDSDCDSGSGSESGSYSESGNGSGSESENSSCWESGKGSGSESESESGKSVVKDLDVQEKENEYSEPEGHEEDDEFLDNDYQFSYSCSDDDALFSENVDTGASGGNETNSCSDSDDYVVDVPSDLDEGKAKRFHKFYLREGFKSRFTHRGILLTTVLVDQNNTLLPIAFIVGWFPNILKIDLGIFRPEQYTFIFDKQRAFSKPLMLSSPRATRRFYVRRLHNNFLKGFVLQACYVEINKSNHCGNTCHMYLTASQLNVMIGTNRLSVMMEHILLLIWRKDFAVVGNKCSFHHYGDKPFLFTFYLSTLGRVLAGLQRQEEESQKRLKRNGEVAIKLKRQRPIVRYKQCGFVGHNAITCQKINEQEMNTQIQLIQEVGQHPIEEGFRYNCNLKEKDLKLLKGLR
ncbi:halomucin, partial [Striga asiatica]